MILYYALGGGLGHLTRGRRVLELLGLAGDAAIVTASPYARDERVTGGIPTVEVPPHLEHAVDEHRGWMRALDAERLIVDTFPGGIQGELCGLEVPMDLVARLLRWDEYRRAVPDELPSFGTTWIVEELAPDHDAFVRANSGRVVSLVGARAFSPRFERAVSPLPVHNFWLIVHSGPEDEVRELIAFTSELRALANNAPDRILVATRCDTPLPSGFERIDIYPASALYARAERIISAAGFNVMLETEPWSHKHEVVPFARKFDDQFLRAARRRAS
ncbi:MAG TPA: hypothetical protein VGQ36_28700 [Thermoanaerobaculia bacterium]|jgi:hypothetical protein|nr:hypothetical protein [Thermoanaerobaculia bacterium]